MKDAMNRLRQLRLDRGLTQDDIAQITGVKPKQVYLWEAGKNEPPGTKLALYIRAVDAPADEVINLILEGYQVDVEARVRELLQTPEGKRRVSRAARQLLDT